jgi:hypothetical protein
MPFSAFKREKKRPLGLGIAFTLWLLLISAGMAALSIYAATPGREGRPPHQWPISSALRRASEASTLVMFVHPKCPCSRSSLSELAILLAHSSAKLHAQIIFLKPSGKSESWTRSDLWRAAEELPGALVVDDVSGQEADLFRVAVSGEIVVYDTKGNLTFYGGITSARGHVGDNAGCDALEAYARTGVSKLDHTPVFGCPLFNRTACQIP